MLTKKELAALAVELVEALDYCGWGDKWERECSEPLRKRIIDLDAELRKLAGQEEGV